MSSLQPNSPPQSQNATETMTSPALHQDPVSSADKLLPSSIAGKSQLQILSLPSELCVAFLAFLPFRDKLACRLCCKTWNRVLATEPGCGIFLNVAKLEVMQIQTLMHAFCVSSMRFSTWDLSSLEHFDEWLNACVSHCILTLNRSGDDWTDLKRALELCCNASAWEFETCKDAQLLEELLAAIRRDTHLLRISSLEESEVFYCDANLALRGSSSSASHLPAVPKRPNLRVSMFEDPVKIPPDMDFLVNLDIACCALEIGKLPSLKWLQKLTCRPSQLSLFDREDTLMKLKELKLVITSPQDHGILRETSEYASVLTRESLTSLSFVDQFSLQDFENMKQYQQSLTSGRMNLTFFCQNFDSSHATVFPHVVELMDHQVGEISRNTGRLMSNLLYMFPHVERTDVVLSSPDSTRYGYYKEEEMEVEWQDIISYAAHLFGSDMEALLLDQHRKVLKTFREHFFVSSHRASPDEMHDLLLEEGCHLFVARYCKYRAKYIDNTVPVRRSRWAFAFE